MSFFILAAPSRTFFISAAGNDSNDGLTQGTSWATIGKVNAQTQQPGDNYLFNGGDTFSDATLTPNVSGTQPYPILFSSYGTGQATISRSAAVGCSITDKSSISVTNLIFTGAAGTTQSGVSVSITTTQKNIILSGLTVSNFAANGILVSCTGSGDLTNLNIINCTSHDNTKLFATSGGSAGIYVRGVNGAQVRGTYNLHNVLISGCVSNNNTGILGQTNWTGSGICLFQCDSGTIKNCTAFSNGASSNAAAGGPVGIFLYDDNGVIVRGCESYNNSTASSDGDGYDADSGCINCIFEYCYSHGNVGNGFQVFAFTDTVNVTGNTGTIIRFCVSEGDGQGTGSRIGGISFDVGSGTLTNPQVYCNTVYGAAGSAADGCIAIVGAVTGGFVANNIFYSPGNNPIVSKDNGGAITTTFTGNDYFSTGTFAISWLGVSYPSLAAWQTATGQEQISGANVSVLSDPTLLAPGSGGTISPANLNTLNAYQLNPGSPMINKGINLVSQYSIDVGTQDFYGNSITATSLPIGCTNSTNTTLTPAQTFIARTGTINYKHRAAYSDLINGLIADAVWPKLDLLYVFATQSSTAALLNLVSTNYTPLVNGAPAFVTDRGYTGTDSSASVFLNTQFNPTTAVSPNFVQDAAHISAWVETNITSGASGGCVIGSTGAAGVAPFTQIFPKYSTGVSFYGINSSPASAGITNASSIGHYIGVRTGANAVFGYKDAVDQSLANTTSAPPINQNFFVLAANAGGVGRVGSAAQVSSVSLGGPLTPTDVTNYHTRLRTYMTAVGAP